MINKGSGSTGRELLLSLVSDNIQGVPIKNNPLGKIHYHSYCNRFFHQIHTLPRGGFAPHTQQISLQYLLWFRNYNHFN